MFTILKSVYFQLWVVRISFPGFKSIVNLAFLTLPAGSLEITLTVPLICIYDNIDEFNEFKHIVFMF